MMTTTQSIFVVFFAIFWGAVASVQGRWKMFHWPLIRHRHVFVRLLLSMLLVNVAPIVFFTAVFFWLRNTPAVPTSQWTWAQTWRQILGGILPAFAVFGFYRLWLGVVEATPRWYYQRLDEQTTELKDIEPTVDSLHVYPKYAVVNIVFAVLYIVVAALGVCLAL